MTDWLSGVGSPDVKAREAKRAEEKKAAEERKETKLKAKKEAAAAKAERCDFRANLRGLRRVIVWGSFWVHFR